MNAKRPHDCLCCEEIPHLQAEVERLQRIVHTMDETMAGIEQILQGR